MATKTTVKYEKDVTVEDIQKEVDGIWKIFKKRFPKSSAHDPGKLTDFYKEMSEEHPQIAQTYPIILRYMCELGQYNSSALKRYMRYLKKHPWNSVDSYLESQAMYALLLFKTLNPHVSAVSAQKYHTMVLDMLKQERKQFEEESTRVSKEVDRRHEVFCTRNMMELRDFFAQHGQSAVDVPISVFAGDDAQPIAAAAASLPEWTKQIDEPDPDITAGCFSC